MLFGDKSKFAIEVFDQEVLAGYNYFIAYILLWIANDDLGDREQKVMIAVPFDRYKDTLEQNFRNTVYSSYSAQEAWEYLRKNAFGDPDEGEDEDESTLRHNICVDFSESFDGESLFLITCDKYERFIWKKYNTTMVKEVFLPVGTYKEAVIAFIKWFEEEKKQIGFHT